MTPFEYVTVLISIILGMGITQIVSGIADLVHQWQRVKIYWPHVLWILLVFFLQIQEWWATFELRQFTSLRLPTFFFVLLYPINLFILARILFPIVSPDGDIDLKNFYHTHYRKFFGWAVPLPMLSIVNNILITHHPWMSQTGHLLVLLILLLLLVPKKITEWMHWTFAIALVTGMVIGLTAIWNDSLTS